MRQHILVLSSVVLCMGGCDRTMPRLPAPPSPSEPAPVFSPQPPPPQTTPAPSPTRPSTMRLRSPKVADVGGWTA